SAAVVLAIAAFFQHSLPALFGLLPVSVFQAQLVFQLPLIAVSLLPPAALPIAVSQLLPPAVSFVSPLALF
ncbi:hypothetical protein KUL67_13350, partial [Bacillus spizizenii]